MENQVAAGPPLPSEENGMGEDYDSTSLSAICARGVTIEDFVDDCYSVAKFNAAYSYVLPGLTDMSQWPTVEKDFILNPPILRRAPGRPKVQRHKSGAENSKSKGNKG